MGILILVMIFVLNGSIAMAEKSGNEQDEIILLNDSAAALEDSDPVISKRLSAFADEREKQWEAENGKKDTPAPPENPGKIKEEADLLNKAIPLIEPTYPLIGKGLKKMVKEMDDSILRK